MQRFNGKVAFEMYHHGSVTLRLSAQITEEQRHFPKDQEAFLCSCCQPGQLFCLPLIIRAMSLNAQATDW